MTYRYGAKIGETLDAIVQIVTETDVTPVSETGDINKKYFISESNVDHSHAKKFIYVQLFAAMPV